MQISASPIALIKLVSEPNQWLRNHTGLETALILREVSFYQDSFLDDQILEISDAPNIGRFQDGLMDNVAPHLHFYVAIPLLTCSGFYMGKLCVADTVPRILTSDQRLGLMALGRQVTAQLESRLNFAKVKGLNQDTVKINRALMMISKCNETLINIKDEVKLIIEICRIAVDIGGYKMSWVGYAEDDEYKTIAPKAYFGIANNFLNEINLSWSEFCDAGRGPGGKTIRNGDMVVVENVLLDPDYPIKEEAVRQGYHSLISLPLKNELRTFGILVLYSEEVHSFNSDEIKLLQDLAENLAAGINNNRAEKERDQLHSAILKMATALSQITDNQFFANLVGSMIDVLGAQAGYVAELSSEEFWTARTLAVQVSGQSIDNYEFKIPEEITHRLLDSDKLWIVNEYAAQDHFQLGINISIKYKSFAALRLNNSINKPIGLIIVFFQTPIKESSHKLIDSMLKIFAARTTSELERLQAEIIITDQASLLDKSREAIVVRSFDHRITYWNKGAERLYGWTAEEAIGKKSFELLKHDVKEFEYAARVLQKEGDWLGEIAKKHKNGEKLIIETHWTMLKDKNGEPKSIFAIELDISNRKIAEDEIRQLAFFDPLTQLPNRRFLMDRLAKAMTKTVRHEYYGALIFIDLDNFKILNDTLGHDKGDTLLKEIAKLLTECIRERDTVARLGGDEFVIMLEDLSLIQNNAQVRARYIGEKILKRLDRTFDFEGYQHKSSSSIGIALFNHQTKNVDDLLKNADIAMYKSKAAGRNTISIFEPESTGK